LCAFIYVKNGGVLCNFQVTKGHLEVCVRKYL